jgi:uncharacterized membrane protein HdeD (DUF308 family)
MTSLIGIIGQFLLGICGVFEAIKTLKTRSSDHSLVFLLTWGIGDAFALWYCFLALNANPILLANYFVNLACVAVILKYRLQS